MLKSTVCDIRTRVGIMKPSGRSIGMHRSIARRDFLDGTRLALATSLFGPTGLQAFADEAGSEYYPPAPTASKGLPSRSA